MASKIVDLLLILFKAISLVPGMYEKYLIYKKDARYKESKLAREKAYQDFLKAKASGDIQAQLNSLDDL